MVGSLQLKLKLKGFLKVCWFDERETFGQPLCAGGYYSFECCGGGLIFKVF